MLVRMLKTQQVAQCSISDPATTDTVPEKVPGSCHMDPSHAHDLSWVGELHSYCHKHGRDPHRAHTRHLCDGRGLQHGGNTGVVG